MLLQQSGEVRIHRRGDEGRFRTALVFQTPFDPSLAYDHADDLTGRDLLLEEAVRDFLRSLAAERKDGYQQQEHEEEEQRKSLSWNGSRRSLVSGWWSASVVVPLSHHRSHHPESLRSLSDQLPAKPHAGLLLLLPVVQLAHPLWPDPTSPP
jgi:hypothetical protein